MAIVGTGVTALAVARQLRRAGLRDYRLFELEDTVGGNSRAGVIEGIPAPWGAHYLPVPDPSQTRLVELLIELGLARREHGRLRYDERALCHAPQERLLIDGHWQAGLTPEPAPGSPAHQDLRRFARLIATHRESGAFGLGRVPACGPTVAALDAQTFGAWLDALHLDSPGLRWYLEYCCRDDFGAGLDEVSAWAGVQYFASRHGFLDPDAAGARADARARGDTDDLGEVLTWPQGNGWLIERMARPHQRAIVTGAMVTRVGPDSLDVWRVATDSVERWDADVIVLAVPLFVAARLLTDPPRALGEIVPRLRYASWRVANVHVPEPLAERPGAPRAWDNVIHGAFAGGALGYVDAMHQSLRSRPGPTVLTSYFAFGGGAESRRRLLEASWSQQADEVLAHLEQAHPDIRSRARRMDIMRWGHGMIIPVPGLRCHPALRALRAPHGRIHFAHSDLAGYSVFEEAFELGDQLGQTLARDWRGRV